MYEWIGSVLLQVKKRDREKESERALAWLERQGDGKRCRSIGQESGRRWRDDVGMSEG